LDSAIAEIAELSAEAKAAHGKQQAASGGSAAGAAAAAKQVRCFYGVYGLW